MIQHFTEEELQKRYPLSMSIKGPRDLDGLSFEQLEKLAQEYRDYLIEVCSRNGGHLGPGLGVVELTMALHRVFESPKDKIVWDIGHQSYPHKLMTGRFREFQGVRKEHGVSGFCRRSESEHDIFGAGHAGTSISAAVGICEGLRRNHDDHHVVAVIGDAGLTAGMAYEGLHQDAAYKKNLIVILNDNEMSIAPNVGAVSQFLSRQMSSPFLHRMQEDVKSLASKIPVLGDDFVQALGKVKHSLKNLLIPTVIFEGFGFHYYGPIDGHDLPNLVEVLENVKKLDEPVLIHVITEKGRGYAPAIADKETFHGCGPYDRESGKIIKNPQAKPGFNKVYTKAMTMLAKHDPKVVAITAAMPGGTGLGAFQKELPEQYYDVGISEQHAVTFAGGLATEGQKPHVAIYSTFMQRAYDQIIHDICIQDLNVKFHLDRAGFVGADGATHHGNYDISYMRAVPNMDVCAPKDERELQELVVAMNKHEGPACVRYPRGAGAGAELYENYEDIAEIRWGTGEVVFFGSDQKLKDSQSRELPLDWIERLVKNGKAHVDLVIAAYGSMVYRSIEVAKELQSKGFSAMVLNARFVKPLDENLFQRSASICPRILCVEENVLNGGFGSAVLEFYESKNLLHSLELRRIGIPDEFYEQASVDSLHKQAGIDFDSICKVALEMAGEGRGELDRPKKAEIAGT